MLAGLTALAPPRPDTVAVVTAARTLSGGATVRAEDLDRTQLPPGAVPDGAWTAPDDVMLIADAGAYGYVMANTYNQRMLPREDVIE